MSMVESRGRIEAAMEHACREANLAWPPQSEGPVPLDKLFNELQLCHEELPRLSRVCAVERMLALGLPRPNVKHDETPLAGFIVVMGPSATVFVSSDDPLTRRRFSAAHELGHFLLHVSPTDEPFIHQDTAQNTHDPAPDEDWLDLAQMEREANQFAARLLMPEPAVRRLVERYSRRHRLTEQFLTYHLATDLLVSREAAAWRLHELRLLPLTTNTNR